MGPNRDSMTRVHTRAAVPHAARRALALVVCLPSLLSAQGTGSVTGVVTDLGGLQPLAAVGVSVVGTQLGSLTEADGSYTIGAVPEGTVELRVDRLGYAPEVRTIQVLEGSVITVDFALQVSAVALDALIVTATGDQRRRELGNATASLRVQDELEATAPTTVTDLLQGRASGVQVLQSSGSVGTASTIKIRGNSSVSLDNTPLIYIDGSRISNDITSGPNVGGQNTSRLNDLDPNDIESIEIVKGPSAATLYGTEAAAGVIRITTRRGLPGVTEWTYRSSFGANWDATDWPASAVNLRVPALGIGPIARDTIYTTNLLEGIGTDQDPWRTGFEQSHGISLRGGVENATYFLSGGWGDREGSLPTNESMNRSMRANLNLAPSENVDVSISAGFGSSDIRLPHSDNSALGYLGVALNGSPWELPLVRTDPVTGEEGVRTCPLAFEAAIAFQRPISTLGDVCGENAFFSGRTFEDVATVSNEQQIERFTGSTAIDYRPAAFLELRGTVGYDQFSDQTGSFVPVDSDLPFGDLSRGYREIQHFVSRNLTVEGNASATFDLASGIRSTTTLGGQFFREKLESASAIGRDLPPGVTNVSNAVRTEGFEDVTETRTLGVFVEQQFAIGDRVFLTPALRFDENSAFGENLGREAYPRMMASWVISDESWFPGSVFQSFRLRGAWGESGKQPSSFAALQLLEGARVTFADEDLAGVTLGQLGNPDLKPERGSELELGFETDLFAGRLAVDFTWYDQVTRDAIVARRLAPSTGYPDRVFDNVGEIRNSGFELGVTGVAVHRSDLRWVWQLVGATNRGEVSRLGDPIVFGLYGDTQRHQENHPFASYFSRSYSVGDDGTVQATPERVQLGHPTPEWEGSLSSTLTLFERVTLYANLGFAGGHQQLNSTEEFRCKFLGGGPNGGICPAIFEKGPEGEPTEEARIKAVAAADGEYGPWIEDADFARLRTLGIRFELPPEWAGTLGARRASVTFAGENFALFTSYSGLDPEVNFAGGDRSARAEYLTLPPSRRVTGRVSITF
ncbi:MAG: SusC/RagA family TonB-linked outer membrane protein [Gemmatimonadota bacterium]